jgi:DNA-directed RNA polymerase specialized sigma24 family protein
MTLEEALKINNMDEIIDSMTAYVYSHIKTIGMKDLQGKQAEDFVAEVLMKVAEGDRDWPKATCSFKEFLFGCLRSHLNNFFKSYKPTFDDEPPTPENIDLNNGDSDDLKSKAILSLIDEGADEDEIDVFECWVDGTKKSSDVAKLLNKDVKEVYNITKRLIRKLPKVQEQIKIFI